MSRNKLKKNLEIAVSLAGVFFFVFMFLISSPAGFPVNKIIVVEKGATLKKVAEKFGQEKIVRYPVLFDMLIRYLGHEKDIRAGKYLFDRPISLIGLMGRLIRGESGIPSIKITIPEGATISDINRIFQNAGFDNFAIKNKELEGYLFPDTYLFLIDNTPEEVVAKMGANLKEKTSGLEEAIKNSGRNFDQILTMASLLEKEASDLENRKIISGILWKRLDKKMLLQVDSTLDYALGKNTFELTTADLRKDNPYNTYTRKGLPPTPICNPGLDAINAAIYPEKTPYWYYLSDKQGNLHYAKTYAEHLLNKAKYINTP